jgi:hypothetical protein
MPLEEGLVLIEDELTLLDEVFELLAEGVDPIAEVLLVGKLLVKVVVVLPAEENVIIGDVLPVVVLEELLGMLLDEDVVGDETENDIVDKTVLLSPLPVDENVLEEIVVEDEAESPPEEEDDVLLVTSLLPDVLKDVIELLVGDVPGPLVVGGPEMLVSEELELLDRGAKAVADEDMLAVVPELPPAEEVAELPLVDGMELPDDAEREFEVELELLELLAGKVSRSAPHTLAEDSCAPRPFLR